MHARICVCCGEPMPGKAFDLSGDPNICPACFFEGDDADFPPDAADAVEPVRENISPALSAESGSRSPVP